MTRSTEKDILSAVSFLSNQISEGVANINNLAEVLEDEGIASVIAPAQADRFKSACEKAAGDCELFAKAARRLIAACEAT